MFTLPFIACKLIPLIVSLQTSSGISARHALFPIPGYTGQCFGEMESKESIRRKCEVLT